MEIISTVDLVELVEAVARRRECLFFELRLLMDGDRFVDVLIRANHDLFSIPVSDGKLLRSDVEDVITRLEAWHEEWVSPPLNSFVAEHGMMRGL